MRQTLDVYDDLGKVKFRVRVPESFSLKSLDLSQPWVVVPTEDDGEVGISLAVATRLVVRERNDQDEADYQVKLALAVAK